MESESFTGYFKSAELTGKLGVDMISRVCDKKLPPQGFKEKKKEKIPFFISFKIYSGTELRPLGDSNAKNILLSTKPLKYYEIFCGNKMFLNIFTIVIFFFLPCI